LLFYCFSQITNILHHSSEELNTNVKIYTVNYNLDTYIFSVFAQHISRQGNQWLRLSLGASCMAQNTEPGFATIIHGKAQGCQINTGFTI